MTDEDKKKTDVKNLIKVVNMDLSEATASGKVCPKCLGIIIEGLDWQYCINCGYYHVDGE